MPCSYACLACGACLACLACLVLLYSNLSVVHHRLEGGKTCSNASLLLASPTTELHGGAKTCSILTLLLSCSTSLSIYRQEHASIYIYIYIYIYPYSNWRIGTRGCPNQRARLGGPSDPLRPTWSPRVARRAARVAPSRSTEPLQATKVDRKGCPRRSETRFSIISGRFWNQF